MSLETFDVICCTKNSALTLGACLSSLKRSDLPIQRIFVIDKNSTDRTREIAEKHGCIYIPNDLNLALARRLGAKLSTTEYFVNVDSDIAIPKNFYSVLKSYVKKNFITKGIFVNQLPEKDWKIADRDFYWIKHNVGSLDCCIIHRETFLKLSEDWKWRKLDCGEDTDLYTKCEKLGLPIHQDNRVVSKHYVFNILRIMKQDRWYGRGSRKGKIKGRFCRTRGEFLPLEMLLFPIMGFIEMLKWKTWRLLFYETAKMFYWYMGYVFG